MILHTALDDLSLLVSSPAVLKYLHHYQQNLCTSWCNTHPQGAGQPNLAVHTRQVNILICSNLILNTRVVSVFWNHFHKKYVFGRYVYFN